MYDMINKLNIIWNKKLDIIPVLIYDIIPFVMISLMSGTMYSRRRVEGAHTIPDHSPECQSLSWCWNILPDLDCSGRVQESPRNPASKRTSSFMISYKISHHYNIRYHIIAMMISYNIIYDIMCSRIIWYERPERFFPRKRWPLSLKGQRLALGLPL